MNKYFNVNNWFHLTAFHVSSLRNYLKEIKIIDPYTEIENISETNLIQISLNTNSDNTSFKDKEDFFVKSTAILDILPEKFNNKEIDKDEFLFQRESYKKISNFKNMYLIIQKYLFDEINQYIFNAIKKKEKSISRIGYPGTMMELLFSMFVKGIPVISIDMPPPDKATLQSKIYYSICNPLKGEEDKDRKIYFKTIEKMTCSKLKELEIYQNEKEFGDSMKKIINESFRLVIKYGKQNTNNHFYNCHMLDIGCIFLFEYEKEE